MPILLDEQQKQAVDALGTNILVSASAGAGKTGVLVQRLKKRIIQDRIRVSRILALTFTAAAAAEMKKRLASELHQAFIDSTSEEEKSWLQAQLIELESAYITTIDSYCLTIIKKYYSVIGLDPATATNILSTGLVNVYQHEAYQKACAYFYDTNKDALIDVLSYFSTRAEDYDTLETIVNKINISAQSTINPTQWYEEAIASYHHIQHLSDLSDEVLDAFFSRIDLQIQSILSNTKNMYRYGEDDPKVDVETIRIKENKIHNCLNALKDRNYGQYKMFLESLALTKTSPGTKENTFYKDSRKKQEDTIKKLLEESYDEKMLIQDHNDITSICTTLVNLSKYTWQLFIQSKQDNACMDFTDMERYALNILEANHGTVASILQDAFDEIMVDEFQDTSDLQNAIIEQISNGHNVFRVGDIKQSIYRFRQAKPSLMRNLMHDAHTLQITLRHNFRSMKSIVEFSNHLFQCIMNVDGCKDQYTELDTVSIGSNRQEEDIVPVEFALIHLQKDDEDEDSMNGKLKKAQWIAKKIVTMKKENSSITYSDFAILVRSHGDKHILKTVFDTYNIPYVIDTRSGFYQSDVCQTIRALLLVLKDRTDTIALLAVLTSGLYRMTDTQLANYRIQYQSIYKAIEQLHPTILQEFNTLQFIADTKGIVAFLKELSIFHDFYDYLDDSQKANFDYLFEMACNTDNASVDDFLEIMEASQDENSSEAVSKGKDDDCITVTTIHQSKGLQYPIVFLWSTFQNRFNDAMNPVMIDDVLKLGIQHISLPYREVRPTIQRMAVEYRSNLEDIEEFIRLLYVAVTRAEKRMFIVDSIKKEMIPEDINLAFLKQRKGMSGLILNALKDDPYFKMADIDSDTIEEQPAIKKQYVDALPRLSIQPQLLTPLYTPSSLEVTQLPELDASSRISGNRYGTKMHNIMALLPNTNWTMDDLSTFDISTNDKQRILAFSQSDIYQQALQMEIHKEYPFYIDTDTERITGTMDFVAINDTNIILIDYKTDNASIEEIIQRYTPQLSTYAHALQIMYPTHTIQTYAYAFHHQQMIPIPIKKIQN